MNEPPAPAPGSTARDIARRIQFMTGLVRKSVRHLATGDIMRAAREAGAAGQVEDQARAEGKPERVEGAGKSAVAGTHGWWVLAQGRILDPEDFDARELARQDLLETVLSAGVLVDENVWVWDETGRAQLVLATLPTLERARRVAERLREKGLAIAVRREMP